MLIVMNCVAYYQLLKLDTNQPWFFWKYLYGSGNFM